jgi:hypothetical protein
MEQEDVRKNEGNLWNFGLSTPLGGMAQRHRLWSRSCIYRTYILLTNSRACVTQLVE